MYDFEYSEVVHQASRDSLFIALEKSYATLASLIDQRTLHLWSRPVPTTGEKNIGSLIVSEALLFGHLVEVFLNEKLVELITEKYGVLKEFYDSFLKRYFTDFSWVEDQVALQWQVSESKYE